MKGKIIFALCLLAVAANETFAQTPTPTPKIVVTDNAKVESFYLPAPDLPTVLQKAEEQTVNYQEEFKNLLGAETKTFESFDKKGKPKKQTVVESNLIVYQSAKNAEQAAEYRSVVKVDGKTVGDSERRATDLFENLANKASAEDELESIQKESLRYDKTLEISGFTLFQTPVLSENMQPFFDFKMDGDETIDGNAVYAISYQQKTKSPYVILNDDGEKPKGIFVEYTVDMPGSIKEPNARLRGKIWIDKQTFQIRRERRELTIQPAELAAPLVVNSTELEYRPSKNLQILTPKRIVYTDYNVKGKDKNITAILDSKATFQYGNFTKSDVEVKSGEVKN